jgi:hypothetical protein
MGLMVRPLFAAISFVVKETQREERDPGTLVVADTVNEQKRRC